MTDRCKQREGPKVKMTFSFGIPSIGQLQRRSQDHWDEMMGELVPVCYLILASSPGWVEDGEWFLSCLNDRYFIRYTAQIMSILGLVLHGGPLHSRLAESPSVCLCGVEALRLWTPRAHELYRSFNSAYSAPSRGMAAFRHLIKTYG